MKPSIVWFLQPAFGNHRLLDGLDLSLSLEVALSGKSPRISSRLQNEFGPCPHMLVTC